MGGLVVGSSAGHGRLGGLGVVLGDVGGGPAEAGADFVGDDLDLGVAGVIGVSRMTGQVNHSNTGKQVMLGGLAGAVGVGLAIPVVNMLFTSGGA